MAKHDIVYLVGHSARHETHLKNIVSLAGMQQDDGGKDVGIVLMQDGVIGTSKRGTVPEPIANLITINIPVHVLAPDMKARGIDPGEAINGVDVIDYDDLVNILADSDRIISIL
ncbi:MAG TPA: sulfurtransferase complex subunit TusB [Candidatus Lokiarchaeia archaeon]|nr:sulfurtransferase complex subunit TusB [Candidatus Lokiarchaeia archaeon]